MRPDTATCMGFEVGTLTVGSLNSQSYNAALRDAVPPYWETTVVLPSSTSPFGEYQSSFSSDNHGRC
jgi:hypothetical protein